MSSTQERAVSVAAAVSSAGQFGSTAQRRQLALERYVAAIAGEEPVHLRTSAADVKAHRQVPDATSTADPTVSSVMHTDAISLPTTTRFTDVLRALASRAVSAIPVVNGDGLAVGVVSEADLLAHVVAHDPHTHIHGRWLGGSRAAQHQLTADLTAGDVMSSPAITTTPEASITQAAAVAAHAHVKVLPVVDASGRVVGIVSRADLLGAYLRQAEQR